ncbi:type VI secretion system baseplate subunit TssF [Yersinia enterocolitica]|uniref:type VI secretion system baseplate subunit TssF n=1 Tax=Yersinia enterocolitica TaxID=630 RepID=UPI00398D612F
MNKFLSYYQKELSFLKKHGKNFSKRFPKIAKRLGFQNGQSEDPHVERLVEAFAFLTARIHQRLDEDLPEIMEALLTNLAPQFLHSFPAACIVAIEPDSVSSGLTDVYMVPAGSKLYSRDEKDFVCDFCTVYPTEILPLTVKEASLIHENNDSSWHLKIQLSAWAGASLNIDSIRFYLNGAENIVCIIYSLLLSEVKTLSLRLNDKVFQLETNYICSVGFDEFETMLPQNGNISYVHSLIMDYFSFRRKFYFIDVKIPQKIHISSKDNITIETVFNNSYMCHDLDRIECNVTSDFFRINCTPAVNLFKKRAEPMIVLDEKHEYKVLGDIRHPREVMVWSVNQVMLKRRDNNNIKTIHLSPQLGLEHFRQNREHNIYWHSFRRQEPTEDGCYEVVYIRLINKEGEAAELDSNDIITMELLCTNGDLPFSMKNGTPLGDFESEIPVASTKIYALCRPTKVINPITMSKINWRIISQLSLNHILYSGPNGADMLREMLSIYNYNQDPGNDRLINWIVDLCVTPITSRLSMTHPGAIAHGVSVLITFDHSAYTDPEYYLFCSFLERFLGLYAPVNSFTRVVTQIENEEHTKRYWPIRAGRLSWL